MLIHPPHHQLTTLRRTVPSQHVRWRRWLVDSLSPPDDPNQAILENLMAETPHIVQCRGGWPSARTAGWMDGWVDRLIRLEKRAPSPLNNSNRPPSAGGGVMDAGWMPDGCWLLGSDGSAKEVPPRKAMSGPPCWSQKTSPFKKISTPSAGKTPLPPHKTRNRDQDGNLVQEPDQEGNGTWVGEFSQHEPRSLLAP